MTFQDREFVGRKTVDGQQSPPAYLADELITPRAALAHSGPQGWPQSPAVPSLPQK